MKKFLFFIVILIGIAATAFFYKIQLGAIPFLLLAIFFIYQAWKIWKGSISKKS